MLEYVAIALMIALATIVALIAIGLGYLFGPRKHSEAKAAPYESGITPFGEGTRRMPVRFYMVAVLFIIFDIETVFMIPWGTHFRELSCGTALVNGACPAGMTSLLGLAEMLVFILILLVGFVYVWKKGALQWD